MLVVCMPMTHSFWLLGFSVGSLVRLQEGDGEEQTMRSGHADGYNSGLVALLQASHPASTTVGKLSTGADRTPPGLQGLLGCVQQAVVTRGRWMGRGVWPQCISLSHACGL